MANQNLKNQNSINDSNNIKVHQGAVFYIGENKPKISKNQSNTIVAVDRQTIIAKKINNDKKIKNNGNNSDLEDIHIEKIETNIRKTNNIADELSISESCISNINTSVNTFSTTNDKNNSNNSLINLNLNKNCNKFNLLDDELKNNDKIIKEFASELEQSTAKVNKLASNKKEIEDNFKNICNKIQPINLKLNNTTLEQIPEHQAHIEKEKEITESINKKENINISVNIKEPADQKEKNRYSITNKSELNTTIVTKNEGNNNTFNTNNNNNEKNSSRINKDIRSTKSKMTLESKDKKEENTSLNTSLNTSNNLRNSLSKSIKGKSLSKYQNQNNMHFPDNNILLNETINSNIDKKMNIYDKKIGDLENFTKEQIYEIMKQLALVKKAYAFVADILKKDKLKSNAKLTGHNTAHNLLGQNSEHIFYNFVNNENRNIMNVSGTNFHRKSIKNDNNISNNKFNNGKLMQTIDDINLSDNLFYNGKYYFNIKDILDKNNIILNSENKKLLKKLDNKLQEELNKNINNSPNSKNQKNNNTSVGDKWAEIKRVGRPVNKNQKPESAKPLFNSEQK